MFPSENGDNYESADDKRGRVEGKKTGIKYGG